MRFAYQVLKGGRVVAFSDAIFHYESTAELAAVNVAKPGNRIRVRTGGKSPRTVREVILRAVRKDAHGEVLNFDYEVPRL